MGRLGVLLSLAAALAWPSAPPAFSSEGEVVEVDDAELARKIEQAIEEGTAWLLKRQDADGLFPEFEPGKLYPGLAENGTQYLHRPGLQALCLLALVKCGVPPGEPAMKKGFERLRALFVKPPYSTYDASAAILALESAGVARAQGGRGRKKDRSSEKTVAKEAKGGKTTGAPGTRFAKSKKGSGPPPRWEEGDQKTIGELVRFLLETQDASGGWRYGKFLAMPADAAGGAPGVADVSATQFSLLGLAAASRCGVPVPTEVYMRAAGYLLLAQEKDGPPRTRAALADVAEGVVSGVPKDRARGWPYMANAAEPHLASAYSGMTAAGVAGLVLCYAGIADSKEIRKKEKEKLLEVIEQSVHDGLAWIDLHFSASANRNAAGNMPGAYRLGYALYTLERAGTLTGLSRIGPGHDWYAEGARFLVREKRPAGKGEAFWEFSHDKPPVSVTDTPYALLFLKKATVRVGYAIGGLDE